MSEVGTKPEQDLEKYSFPHGPESKKTYSRNSKNHFSSTKANNIHTENQAISSNDINLTTEEHKISLDYSGCENTMISNPLENILFELATTHEYDKIFYKIYGENITKHSPVSGWH